MWVQTLSHSQDICVCVCVLVVPFDCPHSSLSIPPSVKRAKTRRENTMVSISSSVNEEAIYWRLLPQLNIDSFISEITQHHMTQQFKMREKHLLSEVKELVDVDHHAAAALHNTHTHTHIYTLCSLSLTLSLSFSLCHALARAVKSWLTRPLSSLSEIILTVIINGALSLPWMCVSVSVCVLHRKS